MGGNEVTELSTQSSAHDSTLYDDKNDHEKQKDKKRKKRKKAEKLVPGEEKEKKKRKVKVVSRAESLLLKCKRDLFALPSILRQCCSLLDFSFMF